MNLKKREYPPEFLARQPVLSNKYRLLFSLGEGRYSKYIPPNQARVRMGLDIPTGQRLAIKIFKASPPFSSQTISSFLNQVNTLARIQHRHIVRVVEFKVNGTEVKSDGSVKTVLYYVMRLAENGEMFRLIHETQTFGEKIARFYFRQIVQAIHHLHKQGIAHRDIKTENVLIDKGYNVKLADFGFSCRYVLDKKRIPMNNSVVMGTTRTSAPESIDPQNFKQYYADDLDLFAAGCVLFQMATKCIPFGNATMEDEHFRKLTVDRNAFWKVFSGDHQCSPEFKNLIQGLLQMDKEKRLTLQQLMAHPWYLGELPSQSQLQKQMGYRFKKLNNTIRLQREAYIKCKMGKKGRKTQQCYQPIQQKTNFQVDKELQQEIIRLAKFFQQRDDPISDNSSNSDSRQSKPEEREKDQEKERDKQY